MARILNLIQRQWRILGRKKNYEQAVLGNSLEAEIWKMLEVEKDWSREVVKEAIVVWVKKRMVFGDQEQS